MEWTLLITIVFLGAITALLLRRRRRQRLAITQHAMRCPLNDCRATVIATSDLAAPPSRRHVDVMACSLVPPTPFVPPPRMAYFADAALPEQYLDDVGRPPQHLVEFACTKPCLFVLNAAESAPGVEPIRPVSGTSDALELARQTQGPAIARLMWYHGA